MQVFKTFEVFGHLTVGGLVFLGYRNTVTVVLEDKHYGQFFVGGAVNGFVNVAFGDGAFALTADDNGIFLAVCLYGASHTAGVQGMVTGTAAHVVDVPLGLGKVVRHVSAATSHIGVSRNRSEERRVGKECRSWWGAYE